MNDSIGRFAVFILSGSLAAPVAIAKDLEPDLQSVYSIMQSHKQALEEIGPGSHLPSKAPGSPAPIPSSSSDVEPVATTGAHLSRDPFAPTSFLLQGGDSSTDLQLTGLPAMRIVGISADHRSALALLAIGNGETLLMRQGDSATVRGANGANVTFRIKSIQSGSVQIESSKEEVLVVR